MSVRGVITVIAFSETESQCKDGRYRFTYIDNGKRVDVYSWKLESTDKLPAGKRYCKALRTIEEKIRKRELLGACSKMEMSVFELVERYVK